MNVVGDVVYSFVSQNIDELQDEFIYDNLMQGLFNIGWKIADVNIVQISFLYLTHLFRKKTILSVI